MRSIKSIFCPVKNSWRKKDLFEMERALSKSCWTEGSKSVSLRGGCSRTDTKQLMWLCDVQLHGKGFHPWNLRICDWSVRFRLAAVQNSDRKAGHKQTGYKCRVQSLQHGRKSPLWKARLIQTWIPALRPLFLVLFLELPGPSEENSIRCPGEEGKHSNRGGKVHLSQLWKKSFHRLSNTKQCGLIISPSTMDIVVWL